MLTGPKTARRSTATNAFDLLTDVRLYMLEEPLRVNMNDWLVRGAANIRKMIDYLNELNRSAYYVNVKAYEIPRDAKPACNTVGCIAGNAVFLVGRTSRRDVEQAALDLLGGADGAEPEDDDNALREDLSCLFHDTHVCDAHGRVAHYGTAKYARIVASWIREFQQAHKAALKAVPVTRKRSGARRR